MVPNQFVSQFKTSKKVTFVGPLFQGARGELDHLHVFIDRGMVYQEEFRQRAVNGYSDFGLGDGDSSSSKLDILLSPEKDFSDLSYGLSLLPQNLQTLYLRGFLGGRKDHEIINLGEVHSALLKTIPHALVSLDDKIIAKSGHLEIKFCGTFSLVVIEEIKVKITGNCKYPLNEFTNLKPLSSRGLSNISHGRIKIEAFGPFFIFFSEDQKWR